MTPIQVDAIVLGASDQANDSVVQVCRGVLERHARSFSAAAVFLNEQMRDDAAVAYAFCRLVDDAVDEAKSESQARSELAVIERMLERERDATPIVGAYMDLCRRVGIGLDPARALIRGAKSDLGRVRIDSDEELLLYCYRVAGTVGLMMCGILEVKDQSAERHAIDLGIGMQLTNICRDVLEDAGRDRVYLPRGRLLRRGIDSEQVASIGTLQQSGETPDRVRVAVSQVVKDLLHMAERYYQSSSRGLSYIPVRPRLAIIVARSLYREIGVALLESGCDPLKGRVRVSPWRKAVLTLSSAMRWATGIFVRVDSAQESSRLLHR